MHLQALKLGANVMKPLKDFRILDLTNVLAGPFCCHQLAHMGADIIKVEVPGSGDLARQLGADPELNHDQPEVRQRQSCIQAASKVL